MHLVIVRTSGSVINLTSYNCQELGLAKALVQKGWRVSLVFAGKCNDKKIFVVDGHEVYVYFVPFKAINQALAWFEGMDDLLEKLEPSIIQIHDFGLFMSYYVVRWAKRHHIKSVLIQGNYRPTQKIGFKQMEMLFNHTFGLYVLNHVTGIGCKTKMAAMYVRRYVDRNVLLTYIGLDTQKFQNAIDRDWKNALHVENSKVLLYVGTLEHRRNPLFLLDVLNNLPSDYALIMVGDGPLMNELKQKIASLHLQNRCFLLGKLQQEELPSLYRLADLFLLASDYEIYGMVILEAMYFNTPVISTFTAGAEVIVSSGEDGVIILNKETNKWSEAIMDICENQSKIDSMREKAKSKIVNELIWNKAADTFVDLYQSIM